MGGGGKRGRGYTGSTGNKSSAAPKTVPSYDYELKLLLREEANSDEKAQRAQERQIEADRRKKLKEEGRPETWTTHKTEVLNSRDRKDLGWKLYRLQRNGGPQPVSSLISQPEAGAAMRPVTIQASPSTEPPARTLPEPQAASASTAPQCETWSSDWKDWEGDWNTSAASDTWNWAENNWRSSEQPAKSSTSSASVPFRFSIGNRIRVKEGVIIMYPADEDGDVETMEGLREGEIYKQLVVDGEESYDVAWDKWDGDIGTVCWHEIELLNSESAHEPLKPDASKPPKYPPPKRTPSDLPVGACQPPPYTRISPPTNPFPHAPPEYTPTQPQPPHAKSIPCNISAKTTHPMLNPPKNPPPMRSKTVIESMESSAVSGETNPPLISTYPHDVEYEVRPPRTTQSQVPSVLGIKDREKEEAQRLRAMSRS